MVTRYKIKNWEKFQHYKERCPPWIKLYRDLLNDKEWFLLDGNIAKFLINLWLLASEADGYLPAIDVIAFRLRLDSDVIVDQLKSLSHYVLMENDSTTLSPCLQDAIPETETEIEAEAEAEAEKRREEKRREEKRREEKKVSGNFEKEIFRITGGQVIGQILELIETFGEANVLDAYYQAEVSKKGNGKISPPYVKAILQSWLRDGKPETAGISAINLKSNNAGTDEPVIKTKQELLDEKYRREYEIEKAERKKAWKEHNLLCFGTETP